MSIKNQKDDTTGYEKHVAENSGDYQVKASKSERVIAKILCIVAAIVLWFYVVMTDTTTDEKTFSGIAVDIRGRDRIENTLGLTIISGYDFTVDITVRGPRAEINRLSVDSISAYIDTKEITAAGEYTLTVRTSLPSGMTAAGLSANYVTVYVDRSTTLSVPIEIVTSQTIESNYTLGTPELNINTVNISGPAEVLAKVDHAQAAFDLGRVSKTLISTGKLVLVDSSGSEISDPYVRMQTNEVTVRFPVYVYKELPLKVEYKYGYYNSSNVDITISPKSIQVRGDPDVVESMDSVVLLQLDEKKILDDQTETANIMLADDVENVSGIKTATITITHKGTSTRDIIVSNITVKNPNDLDYTIDTATIKVRFRGIQSLLNMLNSNTVSASIDLGYLNKSTGTVSVPVSITINDALAGSVYEIGEYKLDVTIK